MTVGNSHGSPRIVDPPHWRPHIITEDWMLLEDLTLILNDFQLLRFVGDLEWMGAIRILPRSTPLFLYIHRTDCLFLPYF